LTNIRIVPVDLFSARNEVEVSKAGKETRQGTAGLARVGAEVLREDQG
jgi:hypothetical protein